MKTLSFLCMFFVASQCFAYDYSIGGLVDPSMDEAYISGEFSSGNYLFVGSDATNTFGNLSEAVRINLDAINFAGNSFLSSHVGEVLHTVDNGAGGITIEFIPLTSFDRLSLNGRDFVAPSYDADTGLTWPFAITVPNLITDFFSLFNVADLLQSITALLLVGVSITLLYAGFRHVRKAGTKL